MCIPLCDCLLLLCSPVLPGCTRRNWGEPPSMDCAQKSPPITGYATTEETKAFSSRFPGLSTHPPAATHFRYDPSMSDYLTGDSRKLLCMVHSQQSPGTVANVQTLLLMAIAAQDRVKASGAARG